MFLLTCTNCKAWLDIEKFSKGDLDSCPHCGIGAFSRAAVQKQPPTAVKTFSFRCPLCQKILQAKDSSVGKRKPCPLCKATIIIPSSEASKSDKPTNNPDRVVISFPDSHPSPQTTPQAATPQPPQGKLPPRLRRLYSDLELVSSRLAKSPFIRIRKHEGTPPDLYLIEYNIRGTESLKDGKIIYRNQHFAEIRLTSEYPRQAPVCRLLTPIFHPNFEPAHICIGDHWTAQERLIDLIIRIGEMITYQSYNIKSPLNGEAAKWADLNPNMLPVDKSDLIPPD